MIQVWDSTNGYTCLKGKNDGQLPSEKLIHAQIDEAVSSRFESYCNILEIKVTDLIQGELRKLIN